MIKNKFFIILSFIILGICIFLFFPFPNNHLLNVGMTFMSFPIRDVDGYITRGIIGSVLFVIALVLLVLGLNKYHKRSIFIVCIIYTILPLLLVGAYQRTFATGIYAVSYDGEGYCETIEINENTVDGQCEIKLVNHSNEDVTFTMELLDDNFSSDEQIRLASLLNLAGPLTFTLSAKEEKTIHMKEKIDISDIRENAAVGTSNNVHFKLIDGEKERVF